MITATKMPGIKRGIILVLLLLVFYLTSGCEKAAQENFKSNISMNVAPGVLTISGNGVQNEGKFSIAEMQKMEEGLASEVYSAVNYWPAKKFYAGKGVRLSYLLRRAGINEDARTITVRASDGYYTTFTREQLEEKRFYFPGLLEGSTEGAREVPAILAWEYGEGSRDLNLAAGEELYLLLGQKGLNDAVAPAFIKKVAALEVSTLPAGRWDAVAAEPAAGLVKRGSAIVLSHPDQDRVKIYYTLDGKTPDESSLVYNPSTSYYQPHLNKPIPVDKDVNIKAVVIGFGKSNSPVESFIYSIK